VRADVEHLDWSKARYMSHEPIHPRADIDVTDRVRGMYRLSHIEILMEVVPRPSTTLLESIHEAGIRRADFKFPSTERLFLELPTVSQIRPSAFD
jgi:hypothetical protein